MHKDTKKIVLLVERECDKQSFTDTRYAHLRVKVMYRKGEIINNYRSDWDDKDSMYYDDLELGCQQDAKSDSPSYGWHVEYRSIYTVDLGKATKMAKTLKTIGMAIDKIHAQYGSATSFEDFAIRFFHAIKADSFCFVTKDSRTGWLHEGEYRFEKDVPLVKSLIADMIDENLKEIKSVLISDLAA